MNGIVVEGDHLHLGRWVRLARRDQLDGLRRRTEEVRGLAGEVHGVVLGPDAVEDEDGLEDLEVGVSNLFRWFHRHPFVAVRNLDLF